MAVVTDDRARDAVRKACTLLWIATPQVVCLGQGSVRYDVPGRYRNGDQKRVGRRIGRFFAGLAHAVSSGPFALIELVVVANHRVRGPADCDALEAADAIRDARQVWLAWATSKPRVGLLTTVDDIPDWRWSGSTCTVDPERWELRWPDGSVLALGVGKRERRRYRSSPDE